jgi:alpha-ketoglutarate-dependent taurine dioxygenase
LVRLGAQLGLTHLDGNLCADEDAVSTITVGGGGERGSDYIPYTDRPLSWHTDGYYNAPQQQIRAWALMCVRDAPEGGENTLMDHEILYLQLRDEEPEYIRALMADDAMGIPANMVHGRAIRPARLGPVFSVHPVDGSLHMRYSARARNIEWKSDAATRAALACMQRLFSPLSPYIYRHRLAPGQCLLSNNVLHNRSGFRDTAGHRRVVYRVRYYDRISL